jgi:hypothetical protein
MGECEVCKKEALLYDCEGVKMCEKCIRKEHVGYFMEWLQDNCLFDLWERYGQDYIKENYREVE